MILFFLSCLAFTTKRFLRYLRYLQQDAYLPKRFLNWLWSSKAFDKKGTAVILSTLVVSLEIAALLLLIITFFEENPLKRGKLKLHLTARSKRIVITAFSLYLPIQIALLIYAPLILQALLFQTTPLFLLAAVSVLSFDEERRQRAFIKKAKDKFTSVSPYVIGITGSYGKTSTKDALSQLLQITCGSTFRPPKGINTDMGITRAISEELKPLTNYAVIEMAAYGRGSIKRLCNLTPPHAGIITGVGLAHLDRFGSEETIYQAKSELAQAIPLDGILVCNGDNAGTRKMATDFPKQTTLLYGLDNSREDLNCYISVKETTVKRTDFSITWNKQTYYGSTPLHGETALSNCAAAFTMACALGAQPKFALAALGTLRAVNNRLQISKDNDRTYIHDAYNSNPEGFLSALNVLNQIPAKKRILMTPGMVELADQQYNQHHKIGKNAAQICDVAIIVGETNRTALSNGLNDGGMENEKILFANHRSEAFEKLAVHLNSGDAVLIENDLPDIYENQETF